MAALPAGDRTRVYRAVMRFWSALRETAAFTKTDLAPVPGAIDDWIEANTASFNAALPQPFRSNATPAQKAILLAMVTLAKYAPDYIRRALGVEVD